MKSKMQDDEKVVDLTVAWAGPEDSGYPEDEIFCLSFLDDGNKGCYVRRQFEKDGRLATLYGVSYSQDMHAAALQVSFNFIKMFHVKSVKIAMRFLTPEIERPLKEQPPGIIQCEMFSIMTKEPTLATNFLRVLAPGCKLELYSSSLSTEDRVSLDTHFFDSAVVKSAPIVAIEYIAEIEDNQLALCRAHTISLTCPNITSRAVNQLILDWLPGKRKITSITLYGMRKPNKQEILLDVPTSSIIPWSEVLKCVPNADWWAKCKDTELSFGLRNFSGELILAILDSTSSSLSDPQW